MLEKNQLLRDPEIEPTGDVLKNALGNTLFGVYEELMKIFTSEFELNPEWRFYNDGKAWLCKVVFKKKTICWLSLWEGQIKTGFYFTEKTKTGITELEIQQEIKEKINNAKAIGKLIPLVFDIETKNQLNDLKEVIKYKKGLK